MLDVYMEQLEHPYLFALVPIAGLLVGVAAIAEVIGATTVAGFLTLYGMVALIICAVGYLGLYSLAYSTAALQRWRIRNSRVE